MTDSTPAPHDLVVLSDLHLGEGKRPGSNRYAPTEDFFQDQALARLLEHLAEQYGDDPSGLRLVLNGDIFDFLTVTAVPEAAEAARLGFEVTRPERKFGLDPTPAKSAYKLGLIAAGHDDAFRALARFVGDGFRVEILRGNHDLELYFEQVRGRFVEELAARDDRLDPEIVRGRVRFHDLFYLEPGRVYIEHGNQYDSTNSFRFPLRPLLEEWRWWKRDVDAQAEPVLDYPLGSIFVRYFYNRVRIIDPYAPRLLSFDEYLDFVRRYNPFDVWRVFRDHYPHFVAALGPATTTGSSVLFSDRAQAAHDAELERRAAEEEHGALYRELDRLKVFPESASKPAIVREMAGPVLKRIAIFGAFAFGALFVWLLMLELIDQIPWAAANAFLLTLFAVLTVAGAAGVWIQLGRKLRQRKDPSRDTCHQRADAIARQVGVKAVLMGHTHMVDIRPIADGAALYANSGTWTSVHNPWNRIMRDARRLTFLRMRGDEVDLVRWNDDAGRIDEVPLFDLERRLFDEPLD